MSNIQSFFSSLISAKRYIAVFATIATSIIVLSTNATYAAGYFTWTAKFANTLKSRTWAQGSGSTVIRSNLGCGTPVYNNVNYTITLYKDQLIDKKIKTVIFTCGSALEYTYTGLAEGKYYFFMSKAHDGNVFSGSGSVTYP
jgi:hypothetical protein